MLERQNVRLKKVEQLKSSGAYAWYIKETVLKEETVQFFNTSITEEY